MNDVRKIYSEIKERERIITDTENEVSYLHIVLTSHAHIQYSNITLKILSSLLIKVAAQNYELYSVAIILIS